MIAGKFPEYELAGIETIARGVFIRDGHLLLCHAKGGNTTYLPGGHIEFGETGRAALAREISEELGLIAKVGQFMGTVENSFVQKKSPHAEINLVYRMEIPDLPLNPTTVPALEDWIEFEWRPLDRLDDLLPTDFRRLAEGGDISFAP